MGDIVKFPGALIDDHTFIVDCARFAEGLLTPKSKSRSNTGSMTRLGTISEPMSYWSKRSRKRNYAESATGPPKGSSRKSTLPKHPMF